MVTDSSRLTRVARALLATLAAMAAMAASGCAVGYVAQAARGQFGVMRARQPIARLLAEPATPAVLRARLTQVSEIRDYATRELGLPDNASYRSYADLGRPYVVWNVVATPELSLEPRQWCFPVAGCVAYRGYFNEASARAFAANLAARGDDVAVFGVAAYSTLGRFADPVLNTMTGYGPLEMAGLIFHELAHQRVYLPGDSGFNEAFATTVEEAGLERYAADHATPAALASWRARERRATDLNAALAESRARLQALYAGSEPAEAKRVARRAEFAALAARIRALETSGGFRSGYHEWLDSGLNNAHVAAVATYRERLPYFQRLLAEQGGDLRRFYVAAEQIAAARLAERRGPPRRHRAGPHPPAA